MITFKEDSPLRLPQMCLYDNVIDLAWHMTLAEES